MATTNANKEQVFNKLIEIKRQKKGMRNYLYNTPELPTFQNTALVDAYLEEFCDWQETGKAWIEEDNTPDEDESALKTESGYTYNEASDTYIVDLKSMPKPLVLSGADHRAIILNYCSDKPLTITELCRKFQIPRNVFEEYRRIFALTHDKEPVSEEELMTVPTDELVGKVLEQRRFNFHQTLEKRTWKETQEDAEKWRMLKGKELDPFEKFFSSFTPKALTPLPDLKVNTGKSNDVFVCGLSDLHFGLVASAKKLFKGRELSSERTGLAVDSYARKIAQTVANTKNGFASAVVFCLGDILNGLRGKTERGTLLENDMIKDEQFDFAMDTLVRYFVRMIEIFGKVEVHAVRGNHDGVDNYVLFKAISSYFRTDKRIVFHNYSTRTALVKVNGVLWILDHGESDTYKNAAVPTSGKARESYIQSLLLTHPEKLVGVKQKIFVQGHMHHFEHFELNDFEFFMFGSTVTGDAYSDHHNWNARPRQNCVVVGDDGIASTLSYYFDDITDADTTSEDLNDLRSELMKA